VIDDLGPIAAFAIAAACFVSAVAGILTGRMLNIIVPGAGVLIASREREPWAYWLSTGMMAFAAVTAIYQAITLTIEVNARAAEPAMVEIISAAPSP